MKLISHWRTLWQRHFFSWIDKRSPQAPQISLNRKNLYIFPNRTGFLYLAVVLVIWLLGTNYQNNLILALSYLMISLFVVAIHHTFANVSGLSLRIIGSQPAFAGEPVIFTLELHTRHQRGCEQLNIGWPQGETRQLSLSWQTPTQLHLRLPSRRRGYLRPGRLLLQSLFPLGIIRTWSWLNLDAVALVYPAPRVVDEPLAQSGQGHQDGGQLRPGGDDFSGLRSYQPGDSIKHIAWKPFAQDKGLFTKEYSAQVSADKWLDWDSLNQPQEQRLSGLCYWALEYERRQLAYGLRLPGLTLAPALGKTHLDQVLKALAQFNLPAEPGYVD